MKCVSARLYMICRNTLLKWKNGFPQEMQAVDPDGLRGTCNKDNGRMRDGDVAVKCLSKVNIKSTETY